MSGRYLLKARNSCDVPWDKDVTITFEPTLSGLTLDYINGSESSFCQGSTTNTSTYFKSTVFNAKYYSWEVSGTGNTVTSNTTYGQFSTSTATVSWHPSFSGTATVKVTAYGCNGSEATATKTVTVRPLPLATITPAGSAVIPFAENNAQLVAPAGVGYMYQWYLDGQAIPGATADRYTAYQTGNYSVQITSNGCSVTSPATSVRSDNNYNYIISRSLLSDVKEGGGAVTIADLRTLTVKQKGEGITYYDGLGRPMQVVSWQTSPTGLDVVQPVHYNGDGREVYKFLPYTGGTSGWFKEDALNPNGTTGKVFEFYNPDVNANPGAVADSRATTSKPFAETGFELSPLNRVLQQGAPGDAWQIISGQSLDNKTVKIEYSSSPENEILRWRYDFTSQTVVSVTPIANHLRQILVTKTIDEHGNSSLEYKDKEGRLVCKKVQDGKPTSGATYTETYYIYDNLGLLRVVIQPEGVKNIAKALVGSQYQISLTGDFAKRWCFTYLYDEKRRVTEKRVPGAGPVFYVYNKRDELILTQDGRQRPDKKWSFTKYDAFGRPVLTGIYVHCEILNEAKKMQAIADGGISCYSSTAQSFSQYEAHTETVTTTAKYAGYTNDAFPTRDASTTVLTATFYDDYDFNNNGKDSEDPSPDLTELAGLAPKTEVSNQTKGRVTGTKTRVLDGQTADLFLKVISFYDAEGRVIQTLADNLFKNGLSDVVKTDVVSTAYDFAGRVVQQKTLHKGNEQVALKEDYTLDNAGRLLTHHHQIGTDATKKVLLKAARYNELGQLVENDLHGETGKPNPAVINLGTGYSSTEQHVIPGGVRKTATATSEINLLDGFEAQLTSDFTAQITTESQTAFLQQIHYKYNIRGWLLSINDAALKNRPYDKDLFGMELTYNDTSTDPQFNGNISGQKWRSALDNHPRQYTYRYDPMNRLSIARYTGGDAAATGAQREDYSVSWYNNPADPASEQGIQYDKNGNIMAMAQFGLRTQSNSTDAGYGLVDNLAYSYGATNGSQLEAGGNRLVKVKDNYAQTAPGLAGDFLDNVQVDARSEEYEYDDYYEGIDKRYGGGNLTKDHNKSMQISYNDLGLTKKIDITTASATGNKISQVSYVYDASGRRLRKVVTDNSRGSTPKITTTEYAGGFVYAEGQLQYFGHTEGRVLTPRTVNGADYAYEYHYKDHLGDLRVAFRKGSTSIHRVTMETDNRESEERQWANVAETRTAVPLARTPNNYSASGLNRNKVMGPWKRIPVSKGDQVKATAWAYYQTDATTNEVSLSFYVNPANTTYSPNVGGTESRNYSRSLFYAGVNISPRPETGNSRVPRAYLKFVFFDKNHQYKGYAQKPLSSDLTLKGQWQELNLQELAPEDGYVQVLVANENETPVWFDDIEVTLQGSLIVQENHYSPWGLNLVGIEKQGSPDHKFQYNSKEKQDDKFDLDGNSTTTSDQLSVGWIDYGARMYDPQLGRWHAVDPKAEKYDGITPYSFVASNPIVLFDPNGEDIWSIFMIGGKQVDYVPEQVKRMYARQYGIKVKYNAKTQMLSYDGRADNRERKDDATRMMTQMLQDNNTDDKAKYGLIIMGTGLEPINYKMVSEGSAERIPAGIYDRNLSGMVNVAYLDISRFDETGNYNRFEYKNIPAETHGIGTAFEHEYFGHKVYSKDGRPSPRQDGTSFKAGEAEEVVNLFRSQRGLPLSYSYGSTPARGFARGIRVFGNVTDPKERGTILRKISSGRIAPEQYAAEKKLY